MTGYADGRGKCLHYDTELQHDISLVYDFILFPSGVIVTLLSSSLFIMSCVLHVSLGRFVLLTLMLQSLLLLGLEMVQQILLLAHSRTRCAVTGLVLIFGHPVLELLMLMELLLYLWMHRELH